MTTKVDQLKADTFVGRHQDGTLRGLDPVDSLRVLASDHGLFRRPPKAAWWTGRLWGGDPVGAAFTPVANVLYYVPFYIPWRISFDRIGFAIAVAELGKGAKLAMYEVGDLNEPDAQLINAGAVSLGAVVGVSLAIDWTPQPGLYGLAMITDSTTAQVYSADRTDWAIAGNIGSTGTTPYVYGFSFGAYAAGPADPFGAAFWVGTPATVPRLMLRVA